MFVLLLLLVATDAAPVTFRFAPPDSVSFEQTVEATHERRIPGFPTMIEKSVTITDVTLVRRGTRYVMTLRPVSTTATRNGDPFDDPLMRVLSGVTVTYSITPEGFIDSITGYGDLAERIASSQPASVAPTLTNMLREDALVSRDRVEWNSRVGDYMGLTLAVGDTLVDVVPYPTPFDDTLSVRTRSTLRAADTPSRVWIERAFETVAPTDSTSSVSGRSSRLIDPSTMLGYDETSSRTLGLVLPPALGGARAVVIDVRRSTFTYR